MRNHIYKLLTGIIIGLFLICGVSLWFALSNPNIIISDHVYDVAFQPTGTVLAVASLTTGLQLWDPETRQLNIASSTPIEGGLPAFGTQVVTWSSDGHYIATDGRNMTVVILQAEDYSVRAELRVSMYPIRSLAFNPDGTLLAVGGAEGVQVWQWQTKQLLWSQEDNRNNTLSFSFDGQYLAGGAVVWRVNDGTLVLDDHAIDTFHIGVVKWMIMHPHASIVALADYDGYVTLIDLTTLQAIHTFQALPGTIISITYSLDGRYLAVGGERTWEAGTPAPEIRVWDIEQKKIVATFAHITFINIEHLSFSPDGQYLAASISTDFPGLSFKQTANIWKLH